MLKDARFAHIAKDPKYRRIPKAERKVKIDRRFKDMFKDKKFTLKYTVDKRGRPVNQTTTENLRKFYDLPSSEDEDDDAPEASSNEKNDKKKGTVESTKEKVRENKSKRQKIKKDKLKCEKEFLNKKSKDENVANCFLNENDLPEMELKEKCEPHSNENSGDESSDDAKSADNSEDESSDKDFSQVDLDENNKQLFKRRKGETSKLTNEIKERLRDLTVNYARGEGVLLTDSSSDEESSENSDDEEEIEHNWGELDKEAETTDEITHRLAICNMDWDRIRAVDLMILLNSFLPSGGLIRSITIYPSEFGLQRIKEEEISGPQELKIENIDSEDEDENEDDNEEGSNYHMEKLRQYQLNRLKYYYAVAEFDSAETANKVYTECDGIEYESTATRLDLRFVPEDMAFDQEPKEVCTEIPEKYEPRHFTTTALQQVKVELTWDETNLDRQEFTQKLNSGKLQDIDENDLQTYLASGSDSDSDTEEKEDITEEKKTVTEEATDNLESDATNDPLGKYKSLLKAIEEEEEAKKNKDVELEFTWGLGTKEKAEKLVKERMKNKEELTPFEQYLEKRKAKRKAKREERKKLDETNSDSEDSLPPDVDVNDSYFAEEFKNGKSRRRRKDDEASDTDREQEENRRKAELELLLMDEDEDGKKHFNMKKIEENATMSKSKRKRLSKKKNVEEKVQEDDFEVNVKDPRFAALYTSHHFNIDPADPHYRKTKGTEALVSEKLKRRTDNELVNENDKQFKKPKTDGKLSTELQALVKSVKKKAQNITQPIKR